MTTQMLNTNKTSRLPGLFEKSLLAKTLALIGIASGLVAVIFILVTLEITQNRAEKQAIERLNELVESTRSMASAACFAHDIALARETTRAFVKNGDVYSVVIRSDGKELARSVRASGKPVEHAESAPLTRTLYSPFDKYDKIGEIVVEPNWRAIHRKASEEMLYTALMMTLIAIGIVGAIAIVIVDLVIHPVNAISEKLHSINASKGEILPIPPNHASNELGQLVGDVNDLVGRLKASLQIEHESNLQRVVNERLRLAAEVFENSQESIMITDSENRIVSVNRAFSEVTGYEQEEVLGKSPDIFSSGRHDHAFYKEMWDALAKVGHWRGELWNRRKDGMIVPHSYSISSVKDKDGKTINYVAIFSDISERKAAEERIEQLAHFDQLTGLPNRVMLQDHFRHALSMAHRNDEKLAVMFFDLDHFKNINDTLGHSIGDQLLMGVSNRIKTVIREEDTVSRLGGDEFIMILPRTDVDGAAIVAEKLIKIVSSPYQIESHELLTTPSIGIAMYPDDGLDMETLSKNADAAMYQAKQSGRNRACFFTQEMQDRSVRNMKLGNALMRAIGNNQLTLYYQPQVSMKDGRITGA
ncbi:MAG TPA: diguanylate cyclase, partial [Burkholderiales bacterium]|nr:diguanylate cyclase [Burkholderiales bacterium]